MAFQICYVPLFAQRDVFNASYYGDAPCVIHFDFVFFSNVEMPRIGGGEAAADPGAPGVLDP